MQRRVTFIFKDDPKNGTVLRALKKIFARQPAEETPSAVDGHAPGQPAASAIAPPLRPQLEPIAAVLEDDAIINRFEPLLIHCPRNTKILETLAQVYARKMMFDKSLNFYQRALEIAGGKNAAIEEAITETTLMKIDLELGQLDPKAPDHAAQRERMENQRLEYQWHTMEESPQRDCHPQPHMAGAPPNNHDSAHHLG